VCKIKQISVGILSEVRSAYWSVVIFPREMVLLRLYIVYRRGGREEVLSGSGIEGDQKRRRERMERALIFRPGLNLGGQDGEHPGMLGESPHNSHSLIGNNFPHHK
jgi:hypothetical protein